MPNDEYKQKRERMMLALKEVMKWVGPKPFNASWVALITPNRELREFIQNSRGSGVSSLFEQAGCVRHINVNETRGRWLVNGKRATLWKVMQ